MQAARGLVALAGCALAMCVSCSSTDEAHDPVPYDGGGPDGAEGAAPDGNTGVDASTPDVDAGPPRSVHCAVTPCVIALSSLSRVVFEQDPIQGLVERELASFCALLDSGRVVCWGTNRRGELGHGPISPSAKPAFVNGIETAKELAGTCVVAADQSVRCWGEGAYLQDSGVVEIHVDPVTLPIPPVKKVRVEKQFEAPGEDFGCAILATDELLCWGYPTDVNQNYLSHVDVGGTSYAERGPKIVPLPNGAVPVDVTLDDAPSGAESTFVRLASGAALSWGDQRFLGRSTSLLLDPYPTPLDLAGVTAVDVTGENVCAVAGGRPYCWGYAAQNVLGQGVPERALPHAVPIGEPVVQISTARERVSAPYQRACAVTRSGRVYCWGENSRGQAGDGTRAFASVPVEVKGLAAPVVAVRALPKATCALDESGRVSCWGDGTEGALGDGDLGTLSVKPLAVVLP